MSAPPLPGALTGPTGTVGTGSGGMIDWARLMELLRGSFGGAGPSSGTPAPPPSGKPGGKLTDLLGGLSDMFGEDEGEEDIFGLAGSGLKPNFAPKAGQLTGAGWGQIY